MAWTVLEYLYRDANNHKAFGRVAFEGMATDGQWEAARGVLDEGTYFVADQIGVPPLCDQLYRWSGNAPTDADHCWHEFVSASVVDESDLPTSISRIGIMDAFIERLMNVDSWNVWLSPNVESWRPISA